jgi:tetratricopeptide (TPR) repeat protein
MRLAPQSVEVQLAAARLALGRQDRPAALALATAALALDPHRLDALLLRAALQAEAGDRAAALASYAAALAQAEGNQAEGSQAGGNQAGGNQAGGGAPEAALALHLARASLLAAMDQPAAERADLDAVLRVQPQQKLANFLQARLLAQAGDWKAADAALLVVGPLLSRLPNGDLLLAVVKANLNQPEQAIEAAQRQVSRTPDNLAAVKALARLRFAQRRPDLAAQALSAAAVHLDDEGLELLGTAYAAGGEPARAEQALRQASVLRPDDTRLLTRLAVLELRQGEAAQAVAALQHALDVQTAPPAAALPAVLPAALETAPAAGPAPSQAQTAATLVLAALAAGEIDRAARALERLQATPADAAETAVLAGMVKLAQVDFAGARAAFESACRLDPKRVDARLDLARTLAMLGETEAAAAALAPLLAADPANLAVVNALVGLRVAAGQTAQAVGVAEAAHAAAPQSVPLLVTLGGLYLAQQAPQKALDLVAAPAPATDGSALALLRARAELALGQRAAAAATLRTLLAGRPDNTALRREVADLLAADHDYDGARGLLHEGLARRPGDPLLSAGLVAVAAEKGGPAAALEAADALARDPANPSAATLRGEVLLAQGHAAAAAAAFHAQRAALDQADPGIARLQLREAQALAAAGQPDAAAALLRRWHAAHPEDDAASLVLASLDLAAGRLPAARAGFEAVLARLPNTPAALNNLAWVRQQQGDLPGARALAMRAYLLQPDASTADTLGWIVLAQGDAANALPLLRAAAQGRAEPAIAYHYAAALARSGQTAAAVATLRPLLAEGARGFDEKPQAARLLAELGS